MYTVVIASHVMFLIGLGDYVSIQFNYYKKQHVVMNWSTEVHMEDGSDDSPMNSSEIDEAIPQQPKTRRRLNNGMASDFSEAPPSTPAGVRAIETSGTSQNPVSKIYRSFNVGPFGNANKCKTFIASAKKIQGVSKIQHIAGGKTFSVRVIPDSMKAFVSLFKGEFSSVKRVEKAVKGTLRLYGFASAADAEKWGMNLVKKDSIVEFKCILSSQNKQNYGILIRFATERKALEFALVKRMGPKNTRLSVYGPTNTTPICRRIIDEFPKEIKMLEFLKDARQSGALPETIGISRNLIESRLWISSFSEIPAGTIVVHQGKQYSIRPLKTRADWNEQTPMEGDSSNQQPPQSPKHKKRPQVKWSTGAVRRYQPSKTPETITAEKSKEESLVDRLYNKIVEKLPQSIMPTLSDLIKNQVAEALRTTSPTKSTGRGSKASAPKSSL